MMTGGTTSLIGEIGNLLLGGMGGKPKLIQTTLRLRVTVLLIDRMSWRWTCGTCRGRLSPFQDRCILNCKKGVPPVCTAEATLLVDDGTGGPANIYVNSLGHVRAVLNPTALLPSLIVSTHSSTITTSALSSSSSSSPAATGKDTLAAAIATVLAAPTNPLSSLSSTECDALEMLSRRFGELEYRREEFVKYRSDATSASAQAPLAIQPTDEYDPWAESHVGPQMKVSSVARELSELITTQSDSSSTEPNTGAALATDERSIANAQRDALFRRLRELDGRLQLVCYAKHFYKRSEMDAVTAMTSASNNPSTFQQRTIAGAYVLTSNCPSLIQRDL
jgi:hypothetical protein